MRAPTSIVRVAYDSLKQMSPPKKTCARRSASIPRRCRPITLLPVFYINKGDPKKAEEVLRLAIQNSSPDDPVPYLRLAGLMLHEGRKADGELVVQQLRDKQPNSATVATAIGDYYLASRNPRMRSRNTNAAWPSTPRTRTCSCGCWRP